MSDLQIGNDALERAVLASNCHVPQQTHAGVVVSGITLLGSRPGLILTDERARIVADYERTMAAHAGR